MGRRNRKEWEFYFQQLKTYIKTNKSQHISVHDEAHQPLRLWIHGQRRQFHKGIISENRIDQLESIGFDFCPDSTAWDKWYQQLINYIDKFGIQALSYRNKYNPKLGIWLYNQKRRYKKGTLPADRLEKLRIAGIKWAL